MKLRDSCTACTLLLWLTGPVMAGPLEPERDPPEVAIGERLFLEARFAQAYYANPGKADPVLEQTKTTNGLLPGPFAGQTMNCRSCHLVDEHAKTANGGTRSYADFAARPPVPAREDGRETSLRNSMVMVNISIPREQGELFHFDGEFNTVEALVKGTLTGRNFGWQPHEAATATKHIASIIRKDDGKGELAQEFGGGYAKIFAGTAEDIPPEFRLPAPYRIDVNSASDHALLDTVATLIAIYVRDLTFATNDAGEYTGSPYDRFLELNNLPRKPEKDESIADYNARLLKEINNKKRWSYVSPKLGRFKTHKQTFTFGPRALNGLKLFLSPGTEKKPGGNCASCHTAPHFSDFDFHNTGLTQINYDAMHGQGEFAKLVLPDLVMRNKDYDQYLPATSQHPKASSRFRAIPAQDKPGFTDLGLWNVFANPDMPSPQVKLQKMLCTEHKRRGNKGCAEDALLDMTVATFKTPLLRDLGHSNPYMHTGQFDSVKQAVLHYLTVGTLARQGSLRNADPRLNEIYLTPGAIDDLVIFLKALNEDYE